MKDCVAILDFGTSRITVLIGARGINNSIAMEGIGICEYGGFTGETWLEPERLGEAVNQVISRAESSARLKINKLYIGVPSQFCITEVNSVTISLGKKRRVLDSDVEALHAQGNYYAGDPSCTVINIQPIYYTLDDDRKLILPVGMSSTRLSGSISYTLCDNRFISVVDAAVRGAGVTETEYIFAPLAEMLFLFDDYKRDSCVMLADAGAYDTTLVIGRGDGICAQYDFPWGGERITLALMNALSVDKETAKLIKQKLNLSLDPEYIPPQVERDPNEPPSDERYIICNEYSIEVNNETLTFPVDKVNDVVRDEIALFAMFVEKALKSCDYDYPEFTALSITGGGLNIRGAAEYISDIIGRDVEFIKPSLPIFENPQMSAALGLMDMVLIGEMPYTGLIGKFRRWINKRRTTK